MTTTTRRRPRKAAAKEPDAPKVEKPSWVLRVYDKVNDQTYISVPDQRATTAREAIEAVIKIHYFRPPWPRVIAAYPTGRETIVCQAIQRDGKWTYKGN